jgi:hypothetical protein
LRVFVDLFNVYGRKNVQGYTYAPIVRGDTVPAEKDGGGWFPFLPSAGVSWEF